MISLLIVVFRMKQVETWVVSFERKRERENGRLRFGRVDYQAKGLLYGEISGAFDLSVVNCHR